MLERTQWSFDFHIIEISICLYKCDSFEETDLCNSHYRMDACLMLIVTYFILHFPAGFLCLVLRVYGSVYHNMVTRRDCFCAICVLSLVLSLWKNLPGRLLICYVNLLMAPNMRLPANGEFTLFDVSGFMNVSGR